MMKDIEKVLNSKSYIDSQSHILKEYHDLIDIFKRQNVNKLAPHHEEYNFKIKLKSEKTSKFEFLYSMS